MRDQNDDCDAQKRRLKGDDGDDVGRADAVPNFQGFFDNFFVLKYNC